MSIPVSCSSCNQRFGAPPNLAGTQVACPSCQTPIAIPATNGASAPTKVAVACQCGNQFQAPSNLFGKQVACPSCGGALMVPNPQTQAPAAPISAASGSPLGLIDRPIALVLAVVADIIAISIVRTSIREFKQNSA